MEGKRRGKKRKGAGTTALLFTAAGALLLFGTVGSSRAALTYFSENYSARITVSDIGVTLVENGKDVSCRDYQGSGDAWDEATGELLTHLPAGTEGQAGVVPGKAYPEELTVRNSGTIDHYMRVMVYRYWTDSAGKRTDVSPDLIRLHLTEGNGWILDEGASTPERLVLYYSRVLGAGETAPPFADTLTVDSAIASRVTESRRTDPETGYTVIETRPAYDGLQFHLEAETDAVQTHSAEAAIKSAWGVDVAVDADGTLWLRQANGGNGRQE